MLGQQLGGVSSAFQVLCGNVATSPKDPRRDRGGSDGVPRDESFVDDK
jgi:hypothetical protein